MRRLLFTISLSFTLLASSSAQVPFAKDSKVLDQVRETAFRHYMPRDGTVYPEKVVCLKADKELSDEFLQRLTLKAAKVVRASECTVDGAYGVQLRRTGEHGVATSIFSIEWINGSEAEVKGGNYWSGIGATYSTLRIVYKQGKWFVKSQTITGIS